MRFGAAVTACLLVVLGAPPTAGPLRAEESTALSTTAPRASACHKVPSCRVVRSDLVPLKAGQPKKLQLGCPSGSFFWNWSAAVAAHVQVMLLDTKLDAKKRETGAVFELYGQTGNGKGWASVALGCSATPTSSGKLVSRRVGYSWDPNQQN